jgi:CRP-like cAMP-binding protein
VNKEKYLMSVPLFEKIKTKELKKLTDKIIEKKYPKDSYLFKQSEEGTSLFLIQSGLVKIFRSDKTGKNKTLAYLKEGDFFGEMSLLDDEKRSANAFVMEDADVLILNGIDFRAELIENPVLAVNLLKKMSERLRAADKQIEDMAFRNLHGRTASLLLELSAKYRKKECSDIVIDLKLTHNEIAEMIGTAREPVTVILNDFKKAGCIAYESKYIRIINPDKLKSWMT